MRMLPWYRIKMTNVNCGANKAIYQGGATDEYWSRIWNIIRSQGPSIMLPVRSGVGMPLIDPYPGREPDYSKKETT